MKSCIKDQYYSIMNSKAYLGMTARNSDAVKDVDLNKDFNSKPKAMKMLKDMLMNRHNMILQEKTIETTSSEDESVEKVSGNK